MIRKTSAAAFRTIMEGNSLTELRKQVYECLYAHGPLTRNELDAILESRRSTPAVSPSHNKRLSELEKRGVVEVVGRKRDPNTGHMCQLWDVTDAMPIKVSKRTVLKPTRKNVAAAVKELESIHKFIVPYGFKYSEDLHKVILWLRDRYSLTDKETYTWDDKSVALTTDAARIAKLEAEIERWKIFSGAANEGQANETG